MPLFCCENCKCVENTALSNYASRNRDIWPVEYVGKKLCSECGPSHYKSGEPTNLGVWHGKFEKRSAVGMFIDDSGFLWSKDQIDAGYLPKHYKIVGKVK